MEKIKKYLYGATVIFVVFLTIFVISLTYNQVQKSNYLGLNQSRSISISAEEIIYQKPDEAKINFSVLTQAVNYDRATEMNNERMSSVNDYLRGEGIEEKNLKTQNFSVRPRYEAIDERSFSSGREIVGYEVENNLQVTVKDLEKIDGLISGTIEAGANKVSGLVFEVSDREELEEEAEIEAIKKAKEKAKKVADSLDVEVGRILEFSRSGGYTPVRYEQMESADMAKGGATPIESGENEIRSSVNITFEIK